MKGGKREGVLEYWSHGLRERLGGAGAEARVPMEQGGKWTARGALLGGWRQIWLCSITRIYTYLHAFTQSSWALTLRALTAGKGLPTLPSKAGGRKLGSGKRWAESGKVDRLFPLRDRLNPPFPR